MEVAGRRRTRVLHVIDGLHGGGSERWVVDVVRLSDADRIEHRVVTVHTDEGRWPYAETLRSFGAYRERSRAPRRRRELAPSPERGGTLGARPHVTRRALSVSGSFSLAAYRLVREWATFRPHVLHGHLVYGFVFGLVLSGVTRTPLVHTVASQASHMEAAVPWLPRLYRASHGHVARFFTAYPEEMRRLGVPARKITQMLGVIDTSATDPVYADRDAHRSRVRQRLGIPDDAPIALSVGRLAPMKGHGSAAAAVASALDRVPELHWVVLGDGDGRVPLEHYVGDLGIGDRARILGFRPDVLPYYAAADVYLRTTLLEAENLSSYQAMAMGLPVIGFDTGASTELLRDVGHGLLVPARDVGALADAIARLLTSPDRGAALGQRGRAHAYRELRIERTIQQIDSAYLELGEASHHG